MLQVRPRDLHVVSQVERLSEAPVGQALMQVVSGTAIPRLLLPADQERAALLGQSMSSGAKPAMAMLPVLRRASA
jgi:hypothetical protein